MRILIKILQIAVMALLSSCRDQQHSPRISTPCLELSASRVTVHHFRRELSMKESRNSLRIGSR